MRRVPGGPSVDRRSVLAGGAALVAALPAAAATRRATPRAELLTPAERAWLAALADALVPGARAAGIVRFVERHIALPPEQSLLMLRYLDVAPPWRDFYRAGLGALVAHVGGTPRAAAWPAVVARLTAASPPHWRGPPSPFFLFAVRADAVDVVYGTQAGFERLGIDYIAHIEPPTPW